MYTTGNITQESQHNSEKTKQSDGRQTLEERSPFSYNYFIQEIPTLKIHSWRNPWQVSETRILTLSWKIISFSPADNLLFKILSDHYLSGYYFFTDLFTVLLPGLFSLSFSPPMAGRQNPNEFFFFFLQSIHTNLEPKYEEVKWKEYEQTE